MSNIGQEDFRVELCDGKYTAVRLVGGGTRWFRLNEPWEAANQNWQHAGAINALIDELHEARKKLQGDAAEIGQRAAHYGDGIQPWDHIVAAGWGAEFAASNALKYVRRYLNKNGEDDLKKGRWYYFELVGMAARWETGDQHAALILEKLDLMLTRQEVQLLRLIKT